MANRLFDTLLTWFGPFILKAGESPAINVLAFFEPWRKYGKTQTALDKVVQLYHSCLTPSSTI